jgi:hypothetical protein
VTDGVENHTRVGSPRAVAVIFLLE